MTVNLKDRASSQTDMAGDWEEADEQEEPRLGGTDIFRGGLVIGLAMLIGGFVMLRGLTQDSTTESSASDTEAAELAPASSEVDLSETTTTGGTDESAATGNIAPADESTTPSSTTSVDSTDVPAMEDSTEAMADEDPEAENVAAPGLRSPAEVRVLVLNGAAQRQGVAASGTEALKAASYNTAAPKNATKTTPQSLILYLEGYQAEGQAVANAFGPDLTGIVQPYDPANPPIDDIQGANVIVIIGEDDIIPIS